MMSDNFSILLVLKGREQYTVRLMSYFNQIRFPYPIIIADGGEDTGLRRLLEDPKRWPNIRYDYKHYGYDQTLDSFHNKMSLAVELIETPLVSVMDNDDFMFLKGIEDSIKFLKDNDEYSSTRGMIQRAQISRDVIGDLRIGDNMYKQHPDSIVASSASDRMIEQTKRFHGNWHNITRSNHIRACWEMLGVAKPKNMRFTEQVTGYMNIIWGHGGRFEYPWLLHQQGQRVTTETGTLANHFPAQEEWIRSDYWVEDFIKMSEIVGVAISEYDSIPVGEAIDLFWRSYSFKLPHLKNILEKEIDKCREVGYNKDRVEELRDIVQKCDIRNVLPIGKQLPSTLSISEETKQLTKFLDPTTRH
jgi:glycosyltransferase domain-containing protein